MLSAAAPFQSISSLSIYKKPAFSLDTEFGDLFIPVEGAGHSSSSMNCKNLNLMTEEEMEMLMREDDGEEQVESKPKSGLVYLSTWNISIVKNSVFGCNWIRLSGLNIEDKKAVSSTEVCRVLSQNSIEDSTGTVYSLVGKMDMIAEALSDSPYDWEIFQDGFKIFEWKKDVLHVLGLNDELLLVKDLFLHAQSINQQKLKSITLEAKEATKITSREVVTKKLTSKKAPAKPKMSTKTPKMPPSKVPARIASKQKLMEIVSHVDMDDSLVGYADDINDSLVQTPDSPDHHIMDESMLPNPTRSSENIIEPESVEKSQKDSEHIKVPSIKTDKKKAGEKAAIVKSKPANRGKSERTKGRSLVVNDESDSDDESAPIKTSELAVEESIALTKVKKRKQKDDIAPKSKKKVIASSSKLSLKASKNVKTVRDEVFEEQVPARCRSGRTTSKPGNWWEV